MKEFRITVEAVPSGFVFSGVVPAHNLRQAWRIFKFMHKRYSNVRFLGARTSERFYSKVY